MMRHEKIRFDIYIKVEDSWIKNIKTILQSQLQHTRRAFQALSIVVRPNVVVDDLLNVWGRKPAASGHAIAQQLADSLNMQKIIFYVYEFDF